MYSYSLVSQIWQIYTSEVKLKKIYIFKHYTPPPPLPLPHSFGPGTFALHSHYNPLFEKILDPPLFNQGQPDDAQKHGLILVQRGNETWSCFRCGSYYSFYYSFSLDIRQLCR